MREAFARSDRLCPVPQLFDRRAEPRSTYETATGLQPMQLRMHDPIVARLQSREYGIALRREFAQEEVAQGIRVRAITVHRSKRGIVIPDRKLVASGRWRIM